MGAEVHQTPFGKFLLYPQDVIGMTTQAGTLWDGGLLAPVAREYGHLGEPGYTILDIGANIGTFSVWLAHHGAWRVIAVEAHSEVMGLLKANLDLNQATCLERVIPIEVAAWHEETRLRQGRNTPLDQDGNIGGHYVIPDPHGPVTGMPLDAYRWLFGQQVSLIKVDVEGAEQPALLGLAETLKRDHPVVVYEQWPSGPVPTKLFQLFADLEYQVHEWPNLSGNYLARWERR